MENRGFLLIVSGPSGVGKGTIINGLRRSFREKHGRELVVSVSATTREPRRGEKNGEHYHFITRDEFEKRAGQGGFIEYAEYAGNLYGTPGDDLDKRVGAGDVVVLDIDVQGARQIKEKYADSVSVFLMPPSEKELERRLAGRGTEAPEKVAKRLRIGMEECGAASEFDHVVCNERVEDTVMKICEIIGAELERKNGGH